MYYVEFTGNPLTPDTLAEEYGHRRAQEICEQHGCKGYTIHGEHMERWQPIENPKVMNPASRRNSAEQPRPQATTATPTKSESGPRWFAEVECLENE
jgi:hypothetical protein